MPHNKLGYTSLSWPKNLRRTLKLSKQRTYVDSEEESERGKKYPWGKRREKKKKKKIDVPS